MVHKSQKTTQDKVVEDPMKKAEEFRKAKEEEEKRKKTMSEAAARQAGKYFVSAEDKISGSKNKKVNKVLDPA